MESVSQIRTILECYERFPFGREIKDEATFTINEVLGKGYFGKELNELRFRKEIYETIFNLLFRSLQFDELNFGNSEDKKITEKFFSDYLNASSDEQSGVEFAYYEYVTRRFFEQFPHLNDCNFMDHFFSFLNITARFIKFRGEESFKDIESENKSLNLILGIAQNKLLDKQSQSKTPNAEKTKRGDVLSKLTPEYSRIIISASEECKKKNGTMNFRELGRKLKIDHKTAKRWLYYAQKQLR